MSTFFAQDVICPSCGHGFEVQLIEGVHVTRLPAVRQQILERDFQVFACPACAVRIAVEGMFVYTDFQRMQYVAVESRAATDWRAARRRHQETFARAFASGPPDANQMAGAFTCRLVYGVLALREKLLLWDAGLDDRVVEALKGARLETLGVAPEDAVLRLETILPGGHLLCGRYQPSRGALAGLAPRAVDFETFPAGDYRKMKERVDELMRSNAWIAEEWFVDFSATQS